MKNSAALLQLISWISVLVIVFYLIRKASIDYRRADLGWAFIAGGAAGNLYDRARLGYVVDFLDFRVWPVFNLADSFITIGVVLILWGWLRPQKG